MPVQRQQRWADIDTTLVALAASESDRNSEVLQQCGYHGANVGPALAALNQHWRRAGNTGSNRECYNSNVALTGQHLRHWSVTATR